MSDRFGDIEGLDEDEEFRIDIPSDLPDPLDGEDFPLNSLSEESTE